MRIISLLLIIFSYFAPNAANAGLKTTTPSDVCNYMKDFGLITGGWINEYDNEFGCSSPYKQLDSGFPLANNLAFYAEGNSTAVNLVKLVLNVNNRNSAKTAHQELLKAAEVLSITATGEKLPKALKDAITDGKKAIAKVGPSSVEIIRFDWPTGKGYEIKVSIN